jgi:hypothetical protein
MRLFVLILAVALLAPAAAVSAPTKRMPPSSPDAPTMAASDNPDFEHQLLVMLRPSGRAHGAIGYGGNNFRARSARQMGRRSAEAIAREHDLTVLTDWPMPSLGLDCYVMRIGQGANRENVLRELADDSHVEWAQAMQQFKLLGAGDPLYPVQPTARRWQLRELHALTTGKDVRVAQIDSGVALEHPDLRGQVAMARNFVPGQSFVAEAHGTEVAGIIVARADNGIGIVGVAPQAQLLALRACWQLVDASAQCSSFTLAQALQFALRSKVQVINLSLTGPRDELLSRLLDVAIGQGIAVVGAVDAGVGDGGFPASHPGVLAVASERSGAFLAGALRAPGQDIPTTKLAGAWGLVSGSSFATAQVSGLVALLLQLTPSLGPTQLREALLASARHGPDPRSETVNACAAVERTQGRCICNCALAAGQANTNPD